MRLRGWVVIVVVALIATTAHAQQATGQLGIERFRLAVDRAGMLDVEWAGVPHHLSWGAGVAIGFAHDPLVVYAEDMTAVDALVEQRLTTSFVGSVALWNRLQLGAALDIVGYQTGSDVLGTMRALPSGGLGDARLLAKLLLVGDARYQIAFVPALTVPGGDAEGYLREAGATLSPGVAASLVVGRLRVATNFGYHVKPRVDTAGLVSDDEAFARIALGVVVGSLRSPVAELWASTSLATPIADAERNQVAIELRAGASRRFTDRIDGFIAGGVGLDNGFGIPDWRALAGVRFEVTTGEPQRVIAVTPVVDPRTQDTDGDGIAAASDRCVDQPEDKDGFQDDDGCADAPATIDGRVVDAGGRPIAGATVTIAQLESARAKPIELTSDADGRFTTQLDGGALELTARAGDYKDGAAKLTVAPGTTGAATVTLARAVRAGQLRGQVLAFDGKPLAATITVKGKTTATTATDADGQYTLELPEGAFAVEISSADHVTQKRNVTIKLDGVTVLNVDLRRTK